MICECENPYCVSPGADMRSPTEEELRLWESEASDEEKDQLKKGEITLSICEGYGAWTATRWDEKEQKSARGFLPSPFRYNVGDRMIVICEGNSFGLTGTVIRRVRLAKTVYPPPVPENYYAIVFEESQNEASFREDDLEAVGL